MSSVPTPEEINAVDFQFHQSDHVLPITVQLPAGSGWVADEVSIRFKTSSAVGNRDLTLTITDEDAVQAADPFHANAVQVASKDIIHEFVTGLAASVNVASKSEVTALPAPLLFTESGKLVISDTATVSAANDKVEVRISASRIDTLPPT